MWLGPTPGNIGEDESSKARRERESQGRNNAHQYLSTSATAATYPIVCLIQIGIVAVSTRFSSVVSNTLLGHYPTRST